jgi:alkylhydroperoxidase/carboxymuconolactone decarboxylase family protein YurZ
MVAVFQEWSNEMAESEMYNKLQATVYCGVPAALESFRIASEVLKQEDEKTAR